MVAPDYRKVVRYESPRLVLIAARDLATFEELQPHDVAVRTIEPHHSLNHSVSKDVVCSLCQREYGWESVRSFPLQTPQEVPFCCC